MYQLHSSFLWLQYRSAPKCGDLILLLPKDLNPALKRYAEGTSPGTGRLSYKLIQGKYCTAGICENSISSLLSEKAAV
ncbi:uncharacterized protein ACIQIH_011317 isoform 2-T4 [Cyanocitta cristata]